MKMKVLDTVTVKEKLREYNLRGLPFFCPELLFDMLSCEPTALNNSCSY